MINSPSSALIVPGNSNASLGSVYRAKIIGNAPETSVVSSNYSFPATGGVIIGGSGQLYRPASPAQPPEHAIINRAASPRLPPNLEFPFTRNQYVTQIGSVFPTTFSKVSGVPPAQTFSRPPPQIFSGISPQTLQAAQVLPNNVGPSLSTRISRVEIMETDP
ncbi:unnamed protein product [Sphagnum balticum]